MGPPFLSSSLEVSSPLEAVVKIAQPLIEGLAKQRSWVHLTRIASFRVGRSNHERQPALSNRFDRGAMGCTPLSTAAASLAPWGTRTSPERRAADRQRHTLPQ